jgi:drug/metabolite transporter (DMT)-like permease
MNSGMALSLVTAFMWGILPVALKRVLQHLDPVTITWVRLVFATVFVGSYYVWSGKWPAPAKFTRWNLAWLFGVAVSMAANYWLFLAGLHLVSPPVAQITIQTGPLFLALGSWYFFSEKLRRRQLAGFFVMLAGFWLFYSGNLGADIGPPHSATEFTGVILVVLAALAWTIYALIQKLLGAHFPSSFILLAGYAGAGIFLGPVSSPGAAANLSASQGWYLLFCCVNTVVAYGCFGEAVRRWEAPRVSAILAITPIITFMASMVEAQIFQGEIPAALMGNSTQLLGAGLVVGGSMAASLSSRGRYKNKGREDSPAP